MSIGINKGFSATQIQLYRDYEIGDSSVFSLKTSDLGKGGKQMLLIIPSRPFLLLCMNGLKNFL